MFRKKNVLTNLVAVLVLYSGYVEANSYSCDVISSTQYFGRMAKDGRYSKPVKTTGQLELSDNFLTFQFKSPESASSTVLHSTRFSAVKCEHDRCTRTAELVKFENKSSIDLVTASGKNPNVKIKAELYLENELMMITTFSVDGCN